MLERDIKVKEKKIKNNGGFSEKGLFNLIEAANSSHEFPIQAMIDDGELSELLGNGKLETAFRKIGSMCIEYHDLELKSHKIMRDGLIVLGGMAAFAIAGYAKEEIIKDVIMSLGLTVSVVHATVKFLIPSMRDQEPGYIPERDPVEDLLESRNRLRNFFISLYLEEEYVDKHLSKIIEVFTKRERRIRKEEEKEAVEAATVRKILADENKIEINRQILGLGGKQETLDNLLSEDTRQVSEKIKNNK